MKFLRFFGIVAAVVAALFAGTYLYFSEFADPRVARLSLSPPELVTLQSRDGETLHGAIYRPPARLYGEGPYRTLISVYGGPHAQLVKNWWGSTIDMRAQFLASRGFLVFKLDNRGSARRGLAFEAHLKHDMGNIEVRDQVDGVHWLVDQGRPLYDMEILKPPEDEEEGLEEEDDLRDELYDRAVQIVAEAQQVSISMIQRRLRIGYNRSARIVERMEREGLVSAPDGPRGRSVLIQQH